MHYDLLLLFLIAIALFGYPFWSDFYKWIRRRRKTERRSEEG